jgi:hypothetical protein
VRKQRGLETISGRYQQALKDSDAHWHSACRPIGVLPAQCGNIERKLSRLKDCADKGNAMNSMQNRRNDISSAMEEAYMSSRDILAENPLTSTLVAFGAGAAIGVLIGHALASSMQPEPATTTSSMEKLGRQVCDVLRSSLPESIGRHLRAS